MAGRRKGRENGRRDELGIGQWREINPDEAIGKGGGDRLSDREGQPSLAHPTRTGQGEQGNGLVQEQRPRDGDLRFPADEAGAENWNGVTQ